MGFATTEVTASKMEDQTKQFQVSQEMRQCVQDCLECHSTCLETATYSLQMGNRQTKVWNIGLLLDCAEMCQVSANFMLRRSNLHGRTCALCAEICEQCAESCEQIGSDSQMRTCAEVCRRCSESCKRMSAMM